MPRLSLSLLGPKQLLLDGKPPRAFTYQKAFALLAYLVVEADVPHSRQELVGLLWPDLPNAAALTNLRQVLADLRQVIGDDTTVPPFLLVTRETIQLNVESDFELDITTFLQLLSACESHPHRHIDRCRLCQARLEAAIALYRGDFLGGFAVEGAAPFEDWVGVQREQLHQRAQQALVYLVSYHVRCRNEEKAQRYLQRQVELEPWQEEAHQQLMRLYARNGQRSRALKQYESCRHILHNELGVAPARLTQLLREQIRDGLPLVEESNTLQQRYWHNLPLSATSLVGRRDELAQLSELLAVPAHRLITILGPGGIGKTRLALAAAAENAVGFRNGVLFVALAGVSDAHFLPHAIVAALDTPLPAHLTPQEQLLTFLRDQELLLLLDNYEHLLPHVDFLTQLLRAAPGVTMLATSRERLAVQAEYLFEIEGLAYPHPELAFSRNTLSDYSALQLFVERARQVQRNVTFTPSDVSAILRIGRITEGMPLALELAAAALRSHSCAAIADALESGRQLLSPQLRDLPKRQRSMQAVFAHSLRLLSADEHQAFCALSLFRGGFTAEAAEDIAGAPRQLLTALVDKSLLRVSHTYRYDMHELMRQFAEKELEKSGAATQVRARYRAYFIGLSREAHVGLTGERPGIWIRRTEQEIDNLRTVLQWLRQDAPEDGLQMAMNLYWLWHSRGYLQEGLDWLLSFSVRINTVSSYSQSDAYRAASFLALCLNKVDQAEHLIMQSLSHFKALDLTDAQNAQGYIYALTRLAFVFHFKAEYGHALVISHEACALARELDAKHYVSIALYGAGESYCMLDQYEQAKQSYAESLSLMKEIGDVRSLGQRFARLANVAFALGDLEQAKSYCHQALATVRETQDQVSTTMALLAAIRIANQESSFLRAAILLGATETILDTNPIVRYWPQDRRSYNTAIATLAEHLSPSELEQLLAKGHTLSLEQTVALALSDQD